MQTTALILIFIFAIAFDAMEDALNRFPDLRKKKRGHRFGAAMIAVFLLYPFVLNLQLQDIWDKAGCFLILLFGYIGIRFSIFNPIWNYASGEELNYLGVTSRVDLYEKLYMPPWSFWVTRFFFFVFGCLCIGVGVSIYG